MFFLFVLFCGELKVHKQFVANLNILRNKESSEWCTFTWDEDCNYINTCTYKMCSIVLSGDAKSEN